MCNLYSMTKSQDAIRRLFDIKHDRAGNMPSFPKVFPDNPAPVIHMTNSERALSMMRWGMPSSQEALLKAAKKRAEKLEAKGKQIDFKELLRMEPDGGTTNIRNTKSKHWTRWLGVENRCVVPFTAFSEFNKAYGGNVWFALDDSEPLAFFAGIWVPKWKSVRKVKDGEVEADLFGFLTTEPNTEVRAVHPKAMPAILTTHDEIETWLTAPLPDALALQRPLADGSLKIIPTDVK